MMQLPTIEINKKGDVLTINIPENNPIAEYLPKAGSNLLSISNSETNTPFQFPLAQIFQSYLSIEFNFSINNQPITWTAIRTAEDRAILSLKPLLQPIQQQAVVASELETENRLTKLPLYNPEATLKRFTDNLPLVVFEIFLYPSGQFEFGFVNKEMEKFFPAFNREAINADNSLLFVRVHPDDKQKLIDSIKDVFKFHVWDIEYRVIENGKTRWVKGYGRPERGSESLHGSCIKVCTYLQDITENKLISERLELSDFTFKNASLPIYFVKEDASIYDFNEAGCKNLGYTREELLKLKIHDLDKDYNEEKWPIHWGDLKAKGKIRVETKQKKKDGSIIDVIISANYLKYGDLQLNCAYVMDITEKKKQEQQFMFFDFMFKNTDLPITIIKKDASFYEFNKAAYELTGHTKEEYSKLSVFATNNSIDKNVWAAHWEELENKGKQVFNTKISKKDGTELDVEIVTNLIRFGEEDFNFTIIKDISEKKKISERLEFAEYAFKKSVVPTVFLREDASFYDFNEAYILEYGYSLEEVQHLKMYEMHGGFDATSWKAYWKVLKESGGLTFETKRKKKDGTYKDVEIRAQIVTYGNQEIDCVYITDLTEKKRAEKNLRIVDFSFRNATIAMHFLTKEGNIYDFNDAASTLLGYTKEEYQLKTIFEISNRHNKNTWALRFQELKKGPNQPYITPLKRKDGSLVYVEIRSEIMTFDDLELCFSSIIDNTVRLKAENELIISNQRYENATLATSDVIWEWNIEDDSNYFSPNWTKVFGQPVAGIEYGIDNVWRRSVHPEDLQKVLDIEAGAINKVFERWEHEYRIKKTTGEYATVYDRGFAVKDEKGNVGRLIGAIQDITEKKKIEEQLRLINFSVRNASTPMSFIKEDGSFYDFNDATCNLLGYTREELMDLKVPMINPSFDSESWKKRWNNTKSKGGEPFYTQLKKKEGTFIDIEVRANIIKYGDIEIYCSTYEDITLKKKAEEELKRSNLRYQYATLATSDVVWEADLLKNEVFISRNFTTFFGHPVADGMMPQENNVWRQNIHPDERDAVIKNQYRAIEADSKEMKFENEYRIRKADGTYALVLDRQFAIKDEKGEMIGVIGAMQDITEKRKTELELKMSIERYEYATIATSDVIWETDFEAETFYLTKNFEILFGHEATYQETLIDNRWVRNVHPDDLTRVLAETNKILHEKENNHWVSEYRFRKANGEYAIVQDKNFAIRNTQGKVIRLVGAIQDITRKKEEEAEKILLLDELIQNNKELKQFSYITTHNLRSPLTNLVSICNLINTDYIEDTRTKKLIEGFKTSTYYLNETLSDLIKVLIIRGNTNLPIEVLSFSEILEEVKTSIYMEIVNKAVTINTDFSDAPVVHFSKPYLSSIFLNLITNSIKYAHEGRYPVVTIKSTKEVDGRIVLTYTDNGIGMDMHRVKDKIFGLYQRFHSNADSKGIGLFLIHSQITALGGSIEVDSEVNVGTTFTIHFKELL